MFFYYFFPRAHFFPFFSLQQNGGCKSSILLVSGWWKSDKLGQIRINWARFAILSDFGLDLAGFDYFEPYLAWLGQTVPDPKLLKHSNQCVFPNVRNVLYFYFGNICSKLKLPANSSAFFSDFKNLPFNVASQKKSWVRSGNWEENLCNLPFWIGKWHFFAEKNCKNLVLSHSENFFKRCQRPGFFKKKLSCNFRDTQSSDSWILHRSRCL